MNVPSEQRPVRHVAIIPDGNRRWARREGINEKEGHTKCFLDVTPRLLRHIWKTEIHTVTLWMFSTDNWNRTKEETDHLMKVFYTFLDTMERIADAQCIAMVHLGRKDRIPFFLRKKIEDVEGNTAHHKGGNFLFALDYSGRDEILRAMEKMARAGIDQHGRIFESHLDTSHIANPDPDIVIRTSGELRTSGFMIWQSAYSEYFFIDKYYPDMCIQDLDNVIEEYYKRDKRYGH